MNKLKKECEICFEYNKLDCGGEYLEGNSKPEKPSCYRYRERYKERRREIWDMLQIAHYTDEEQVEIEQLYDFLMNMCKSMNREEKNFLENALEIRRSETIILLKEVLER